MNVFRKPLFLLLFLTSALTGIIADTGLPLNLEHELQSKGEMVRYFYGDLDLQYLPFGSLSDTVITDLQGQDSTIGVEALFMMDMPKSLAQAPDRDLKIYNLLNRISTLKGIEYYSASRDRMRTLFKEAYRVDENGSRTPLKDLSYNTIPSENEAIVFQEDLTFGKNYVRTRFHYKDGRFLMQVSNLTTMWYYILPLVKPENFRMNLLIIPSGDSLIFYGASSVDSASLFGIEKSKKDSFYNRIKAMQNWFKTQMETEFP